MLLTGKDQTVLPSTAKP